jgi:hypothetical protein
MNPFDPMCGRFAEDIIEYDNYIYTSHEELDSTPEDEKKVDRIKYVIIEEGTYNSENGHFLCDECYIKAGQPSSPTGWVCP